MMKFETLLALFSDQPIFDFASVVVLCGESRESTRVALHRMKKAGRIIELKRGLYAFAAPYRRVPLNAAKLANLLYAPSYLSERWALSWYGVIPEKTVIYTSVTTRPTRSFENAMGNFQYRTIQTTLFGPYRTDTIMSQEIHIASPEKALFDLWYLEHGEWTQARMESHRFEPRNVDTAALRALVTACRLPRLARAMHAWEDYAREAAQGIMI
ncbi:MAG: type IV toxin-antitoxin system AbiEi family antitoxin domain-containing protein [Nitrospirota bacterium]|jgi:predicted transcriptional regulator of viral defense system